ncbi:MAG: glycoside hydrolase family 127 protein [Clostridia bacterium]|nr:glycoside hydrolase family 127 protein [Clostridia bacterium]
MKSSRISVKNFHADDSFVGRVQKLVREEVIPYQYQVLNDALPGVEKSHAIENIRLAAKKLRVEDIGAEEFYGFIFQDSDVAKWIEAAAYALAAEPNPELEKTVDDVIALYGSSQHENGYVNSYFTIQAPEKKWTNMREAHELYCAGHMMEAAVAYYEVTGKRELLDIMSKNADCIFEEFMHHNTAAYPGHPEVELALMRLWRATGNEKYKALAKHFIDERGQEPNYFWKIEEPNRGWNVWSGSAEQDSDYTQSTLPVREQKDAVGHSVRAAYLYTGMADVARETEDADLLSACRTLWNSITKRRMYVTGGIGSTNQGEAFTVDYDLPNDPVYAETCASIALMFFAKQLLENEHRGEYADVMERAFYNTVLAGMQLDGKRFFYVNPLEVIPGVSGKAVTHRHDLPVRPQWYACACCPPNVARVVSSLGAYAYSENETAFFIDLYAGGTVVTEKGLTLTCRTEFPHYGDVRYTVSGNAETTLAFRIPAWSENTKLTVNGEELALSDITCDGYAYITRAWQDGDNVMLTLDMTARVLYASPKVAADSGKVCVQRGALVYCAEEADNGEILPLFVREDAVPEALGFEPETLGGIVPVEIDGYKAEDNGMLYSARKPKLTEKKLRLIPYYTWANRGENQMRVWLPVK